MNQDTLVNEVLLLGEHDLIQASEIASVVIESHTSELTTSELTKESILRKSIWIVGRLLERELATVGDAVLQEKNGEMMVAFRPWNVSVDIALQRIEAGWRTLPDGPSLGDVCWLELTAKGKQRAASVSRADHWNDSER